MPPIYRLRQLSALGLIAMACWWITVSTKAQAQSIDLNKAKVSYTYNFAKNIRWPNEDSKTSFKVGLFEVQDPELLAQFKLLEKTQLKTLSIEISETRNFNSLSRYDVVYVGTNDEGTINRIQSIIQGLPVLMVTNNLSNKRLVMLNLFTTDNQQLQFEINKANILNSGLRPLPELILLGGTEIDIAALYREGQASLIELQNQLNLQQQQLILTEPMVYSMVILRL